ncbi:MAG: neutral/alkaline non-lysosomal ceramidase N-terminal domain-containing protein [Planctomycetes bacterium]|nr:neutral/alkaline non-lysosomal ceramidase N-terminal domain-containing protein [Planctomycetota bacterium]
MKTRLAVLCVLSFSVVLLFASPSPAGNAAGLKAGAARIDITPEKPVNMSGYAARKGLSTGVHDPLSARAVAFEVNGKRLVLISTDIIGFYEEVGGVMRQAIQDECKLQPSELFLCGIHTHSAPTPTLNRERAHANNVEYTEALKPKLVEVARKALANMEPVKLGLGVGSCPVGGNRRELRVANNGESSIVLGRNPYGTTDKEVLVMKVAKADGAPLAVMFDYATHGTALGTGNLTISGDVPGLAEQFVEKILGGDVVAPIFVGASGNIDPWFRVLPKINEEPGWVPEPVLLGTFLGEEVVSVYRAIRQTNSADPTRSGAAGKIATNFVTLQLPARPPEAGSTEKKQDSVPLNVTVARLGDVAFVGLGAEVFTEIGVAIKAGSPCPHTFVITHCNGSAGYLPIKEAYVQDGYEVKSSRFGPQAAEIVVREAIRLLQDL